MKVPAPGDILEIKLGLAHFSGGIDPTHKASILIAQSHSRNPISNTVTIQPDLSVSFREMNFQTIMSNTSNSSSS